MLGQSLTHIPSGAKRQKTEITRNEQCNAAGKNAQQKTQLQTTRIRLKINLKTSFATDSAQLVYKKPNVAAFEILAKISVYYCPTKANRAKTATAGTNIVFGE